MPSSMALGIGFLTLVLGEYFQAMPGYSLETALLVELVTRE